MNPLTLAPEAIPVLMSRLTPRQLEIVGLLAQGQSTKQTSIILSISSETVKRHIYRACQKTELENRTQLIVLFTMWNVSSKGIKNEIDSYNDL